MKKKPLLQLLDVLSMGLLVVTFIFIVLVLMSCMPKIAKPDVTIEEIQISAPDEYACKVTYTEGEEVFYVACPGQDPVGIPILSGPKGPTGDDGEQGRDGSAGVFGEPGPQGEEGPAGPAGEQGPRGDPGVPGTDGTDGVSAIMEVIDPCGPQGQFDELLFRLNAMACADVEQTNCTDLFAVYASNKKIHLTGLYPGVYLTTDGTECVFKVDNELKVTW